MKSSGYFNSCQENMTAFLFPKEDKAQMSELGTRLNEHIFQNFYNYLPVHFTADEVDLSTDGVGDDFFHVSFAAFLCRVICKKINVQHFGKPCP